MRSTDGPLYPVTDVWVHEVSLALRQRHLSCVQLARQVGTSTASVTKLLDGKVRQSRLVRPIAKLLGVDMPGVFDAGTPFAEPMDRPHVAGDELPDLGYARYGDRVLLTMSVSDYDFLLILLGMAVGNALATGAPVGPIVALTNRLNAGHPTYTAYEVPEP
jgi:hypothetical protein